MVRFVRSSFALSVISIFVAAVPLSAQVRFERKLSERSSYVKESNVQIEQKLTIAGMETDSTTKTNSICRAVSGERDSSGRLELVERNEQFKTVMSAGGFKYEFDSNQPDKKGNSPLEIIRDIHKVLAQCSTTYVFNRDNLVEEVRCDMDVLEKLPPQIQQLVQGQLEPENLKIAVNEELNFFPKTSIRPGDSWERSETANFGSGQYMTFKTRMTYEGSIDSAGTKLEKITTKVLSGEFYLKDSTIPFTLKHATMEIPESEGYLMFDLAGGRVVESSSKTRITGDIEFELKGRPLPSKLDLRISRHTIIK